MPAALLSFPLAILALLALGCAGKPRVGAVDLAVAPNPEAPLTARLRFTTDRPARTRLVIDDGERRTEALAEKDYATDHEVMVLGLRAGRRHRVAISVEDEAGNVGTAPAVEVATAPLPADFPEVEVLTRNAERMEPGVTVLSLIRWSGVKPDAKWGALVAYDAEGDVVWYYKGADFLDEARPLPNGHLLTLYSDEGQMLEMDMLGTIARRWHTTGIPKEGVPSTSIAVDADTFHHDVCRTPSGNLLVLSSEVRRFDDYPSSETDPRAPRRPTNVVGDVLLELTPEGKVVGRHRFLDLLDPYLLGYDSLDTGFWLEVYDQYEDDPARDWAHANSLHCESDDRALVSFNHLSALVALDLRKGAIEWLFSEPTGWKEPWSSKLLAAGEGFEWPYYFHAVTRTRRGTLLLFDNGIARARPFRPRVPAAEAWSRAVELAVDEQARTVSQVWSYGGPGADRFLTPFLSEADELPTTGNILITDGGHVRGADGADTDEVAGGHHWGRVLEVTHSEPPEKVWELRIDNPDSGWAIYRGERLPSLYPSEW
jgi:arylsulfate sulfotransferase